MNGPVLEVKMKNIQEISSLIAQKIEVESQKKVMLKYLQKYTWALTISSCFSDYFLNFFLQNNQNWYFIILIL